ncbi:MAG TPA: UTP--glucose-1-phosphate uridylyltransferase [Patescibacteria group bacterium]|nr:UTP--glucose-1-phosphate uridylyltransferase [Patescibacteria group bacterium]
MKRVTKAVIPAAGFGTRFLPQTKAMPKEMLPIVDKPVIQIVVEELVDAGIKDIIIVTGYHKRAIEDHFDLPNTDLIENLRMGGEKKKHLMEEVQRISEMANFIYVRQKGPYGNGTPLLNVRHLIGDEPFIYTWSDDFIVSSPSSVKQMISVYEKYGSSVLAGIKATKDEDYDRYGFSAGKVLDDGVIDVDTLIEKPGKEKAPSDNTNLSFLFTPEIFKYMDKAMENLEEGKELYWNDPVKLMLADRIKVYSTEIKNAKYYDMGNKLEYVKAIVDFGLKHPETGESFKKYLEEISHKGF